MASKIKLQSSKIKSIVIVSRKAHSLGMLLRDVLGTESKVRRFLSGELATKSQCAQNMNDSEFTTVIVVNGIRGYKKFHKSN